MDRSRFEKSLQAYLDGTLEGEALEEFLLAVDGNAEYSEILRQETALNALLQDRPTPHAPRNLSANIMNAVRKAATVEEAPVKSRSFAQVVNAWPARLAMAAMLLAVVGVSVLPVILSRLDQQTASRDIASARNYSDSPASARTAAQYDAVESELALEETAMTALDDGVAEADADNAPSPEIAVAEDSRDALEDSLEGGKTTMLAKAEEEADIRPEAAQAGIGATAFSTQSSENPSDIPALSEEEKTLRTLALLQEPEPNEPEENAIVASAMPFENQAAPSSPAVPSPSESMSTDETRREKLGLMEYKSNPGPDPEPDWETDKDIEKRKEETIHYFDLFEVERREAEQNQRERQRQIAMRFQEEEQERSRPARTQPDQNTRETAQDTKDWDFFERSRQRNLQERLVPPEIPDDSDAGVSVPRIVERTESPERRLVAERRGTQPEKKLPEMRVPAPTPRPTPKPTPRPTATATPTPEPPAPAIVAIYLKPQADQPRVATQVKPDDAPRAEAGGARPDRDPEPKAAVRRTESVSPSAQLSVRQIVDHLSKNGVKVEETRSNPRKNSTTILCRVDGKDLKWLGQTLQALNMHHAKTLPQARRVSGPAFALARNTQTREGEPLRLILQIYEKED